MFLGRNLCIATMHKKEKAIAPILERELGVKCFTCNDLNTDLMGTFSGEIERKGSPLEAAKEKCLQAIVLTQCDLAISSEGSFGAHPTIGFIPCDEEILFFYDKKNRLEITVRELSTTTNFCGDKINTREELINFANKAQFPSHGLVLKNESDNIIAKGIIDWKELEENFNKIVSKGQFAKIETDMRAHFNPTRMSIIAKCTEKLVNAIKSECPKCKAPGFIVTHSEPGLPCELCNLPTKSSLKHIRICKSCGFKNEIIYPHQKMFEQAIYCDFCNP